MKKVEFEFSHRSKPYTEMKTRVTRLSIVRIDQAWLLFSLLLYISKTQTSLSLKERENRKEKTNAAWSKKVSQVCNSKICCSLHIEVKNKSKYEFLLYRYSAFFSCRSINYRNNWNKEKLCFNISNSRLSNAFLLTHISLYSKKTKNKFSSIFIRPVLWVSLHFFNHYWLRIPSYV